MTDSAQVKLARHGNADAWEGLVQAHQEAVFRLAYLLLGDPDDAQDVVQETFLRAYHSLARFDADRPLRPWLLRIASNLASNRRRALGRYFAALMRFARWQTADPPEPAPAAPEAARLWQAARQLPPAQQQIVYLRYFLELPEGEIAASLKVPAGTVKSRLHRALARLRGIIERDYPDLKDLFES